MTTLPKTNTHSHRASQKESSLRTMFFFAAMFVLGSVLVDAITLGCWLLSNFGRGQRTSRLHSSAKGDVFVALVG